MIGNTWNLIDTGSLAEWGDGQQWLDVLNGLAENLHCQQNNNGGDPIRIANVKRDWKKNNQQ